MNKKKLGLLCTALTAFSFAGSVFAADCAAYANMNINTFKQTYSNNPIAASTLATALDACVNNSTQVCNQANGSIQQCNAKLYIRDFLANYYAKNAQQPVPPVPPFGMPSAATPSSFGSQGPTTPQATAAQSMPQELQPTKKTKTPPPFTIGNVKSTTSKSNSSSNSIHWF